MEVFTAYLPNYRGIGNYSYGGQVMGLGEVICKGFDKEDFGTTGRRLG